MKYYLVSLGCPKNRVDSEVLASYLIKDGGEIVSQLHSANVVIINTCSFVKPALEESFREIKRFIKLKEKLGFKLVVVGCLVDRFSQENWHEHNGVDMAVSSSLIPKISELLKGNKRKTFLGPLGFLPNSKDRKIISTFPFAYLKLSEGCNVRCSYCTIPYFKGRYRSRPLEDVIFEAEYLLSKGIRELVLVSQDTGLYGKDLEDKYSLKDLLKKLNDLPGYFWIRLMYLNPMRLDEELLDYIAGLEKVVKYIDIPIQHTHDEVLKLMERPYGYRFVINLLGKIRKIIPGVALRSTFIVGFPGEKRQYFNHLLQSLVDLKIPKVGFFSYYPEENTRAYIFPNRLSSYTVSRRLKEAQKLQTQVLEEYNKSLIGKIYELLVETNQGWISGRLQYDAPEIDSLVYLEGKGKKLNSGDFVKVKIVGYEGVDLRGKLV